MTGPVRPAGVTGDVTRWVMTPTLPEPELAPQDGDVKPLLLRLPRLGMLDLREE